MNIFFDYLNKYARVDIEEGYEAAKTYYRRYDLDREYMVRPDPINDCKRSWLGELMPFPDIPDATFKSTEVKNGVQCNYFVVEEYDTLVHIYMDVKTDAPVQLVQESRTDGLLLTYDYSNVVLGPPAEELFELPAPYTHETCVKHAGGYPYLHIFHHFVKF